MLTKRTASTLSHKTCHAGRVPRVCATPVPVRRSVVTRSAQPDEQQPSTTEAAPALLKDMQVSWDRFLQRYEHSMLSAGIGAGAVTTWCMLHGQSPGEAAFITVVSTITALVLNEVLFTDGQA